MNGNDMAFPVENRDQTPNETIQLGLTKRELFAAMAMQGMCSGSPWPYPDDGPEMAQRALRFADALLAALHPKDVSRG